MTCAKHREILNGVKGEEQFSEHPERNLILNEVMDEGRAQIIFNIQEFGLDCLEKRLVDQSPKRYSAVSWKLNFAQSISGCQLIKLIL